MYDATGLPYCGAPPSPADWFWRWNFDPALIAVLAAVALGYEVLARRTRDGSTEAPSARERALFRTGFGLLALALVSPLCAMSVALFSARVSQHLVLLFVAVPLIVASRPLAGLRRGAHSGAVPGPAVASMLFAAAFWAWHLPGWYAATFTSTAVYWTMHATLIGVAALYWHTVLANGDGRCRQPDASVLPRTLALVSGLAQMGVLGAVLSLATRLVYTPHVATAPAFGLTALEDQQLGGVIMWVPGGLSFVFVALLLVRSLLVSADARQAASS